MNYKKQSELLESILVDVEREVIGVKFVFSEDEWNKISGIDLKKPLPYCVCVKSASLGHSIKMLSEKGGCRGGNRALGIDEPSKEYYEGKSGVELGLYKDSIIGKKVVESNSINKVKPYGLIIKPLSQYEVDPDVVLVIGNSYSIMRLVQGYSYHFGINSSFSLSGNQAVCLESTVKPYLNNDINISMLCSGTRYKAKWGKNEIVAGIPYSKLETIIDGIVSTINPTEMDENKEIIVNGLKSNGLINDVNIVLGSTYYWTKENNELNGNCKEKNK